MAQNYKRRKYFIDRGAQGRFIAAFAGASLAGGLVAVLCFRHFARLKLEATLYAMRLPDIPMHNLLLDEMLLTTALTAGFVLLLFMLTARQVFARVDGPLRRMAGALRGVSEGDLKNAVRLREKDEFQEFAGEVDAMVRQMNTRFSDLRQQAEAISRLCGEARAAEAGDRIRDRIRAMQKEMQVFKL